VSQPPTSAQVGVPIGQKGRKEKKRKRKERQIKRKEKKEKKRKRKNRKPASGASAGATAAGRLLPSLHDAMNRHAQGLQRQVWDRRMAVDAAWLGSRSCFRAHRW
jgi:hypothetical protein